MILVHGITVAGRRWSKGTLLGAEDLARLGPARVPVTVAVTAADDVHEDAAAAAMANALVGDGLRVSVPSTGRVNLVAAVEGLLRLDVERLHALNELDESLTVATLSPDSRVAPKQLVATVKVIPFAVPGRVLEAWTAKAGAAEPAVSVSGFDSRRALLIQTRLAGAPAERSAKLEAKTAQAVARRLRSLGGELVDGPVVEHGVGPLTGALRRAAEDPALDLVLIAGAVATTDRQDVVPRALLNAGGRVDQLGMPVDPGNLLLLGRLGAGAPAAAGEPGKTVIGLPGCARSPKLNGFDWVLERVCAGWPVGPAELRRLGVGGLLKEIPSRPAPRSHAVPWPKAGGVEAVILAAGRSSRMRSGHKLLLPWRGRPMVSWAVDIVRQAGLERPFLVSGARHREVEAAVDGEVRAVHNPDFSLGMSTSLRRGIAALPDACGGALICLGDMPSVDPQTLKTLIRAFEATDGDVICVPVNRGRRGHPVLIGRSFFAEIHEIEGDRGARALLAAYAEAVVEVEVEDAGIFQDVDSDEDLLAGGPDLGGV